MRKPARTAISPGGRHMSRCPVMSTDNVKLAVIIVSYGNADDVDRCLKSLARSDLNHFEIFICENGGEVAYKTLLATLRGSDKTLHRMPGSIVALDKPQKRLVSVAKCRFQDSANVVRIGLATENLGYGGGVNAWLEPLLGVSG